MSERHYYVIVLFRIPHLHVIAYVEGIPMMNIIDLTIHNVQKCACAVGKLLCGLCVSVGDNQLAFACG